MMRSKDEASWSLHALRPLGGCMLRHPHEQGVTPGELVIRRPERYSRRCCVFTRYRRMDSCPPPTHEAATVACGSAGNPTGITCGSFLRLFGAKIERLRRPSRGALLRLQPGRERDLYRRHALRQRFSRPLALHAGPERVGDNKQVAKWQREGDAQQHEHLTILPRTRCSRMLSEKQAAHFTQCPKQTPLGRVHSVCRFVQCCDV